jgi:hypothetical protein
MIESYFHVYLYTLCSYLLVVADTRKSVNSKCLFTANTYRLGRMKWNVVWYASSKYIVQNGTKLLCSKLGWIVLAHS